MGREHELRRRIRNRDRADDAACCGARVEGDVSTGGSDWETSQAAGQ